jgi:hypothetical protein
MLESTGLHGRQYVLTLCVFFNVTAILRSMHANLSYAFGLEARMLIEALTIASRMVDNNKACSPISVQQRFFFVWVCS